MRTPAPALLKFSIARKPIDIETKFHGFEFRASAAIAFCRKYCILSASQASLTLYPRHLFLCLCLFFFFFNFFFISIIIRIGGWFSIVLYSCTWKFERERVITAITAAIYTVYGLLVECVRRKREKENKWRRVAWIIFPSQSVFINAVDE